MIHDVNRSKQPDRERTKLTIFCSINSSWCSSRSIMTFEIWITGPYCFATSIEKFCSACIDSISFPSRFYYFNSTYHKLCAYVVNIIIYFLQGLQFQLKSMQEIAYSTVCTVCTANCPVLLYCYCIIYRKMFRLPVAIEYFVVHSLHYTSW